MQKGTLARNGSCRFLIGARGTTFLMDKSCKIQEGYRRLLGSYGDQRDLYNGWGCRVT